MTGFLLFGLALAVAVGTDVVPPEETLTIIADDQTLPLELYRMKNVAYVPLLPLSDALNV
jgi:hypothetical protein